MAATARDGGSGSGSVNRVSLLSTTDTADGFHDGIVRSVGAGAEEVCVRVRVCVCLRVFVFVPCTVV